MIVRQRRAILSPALTGLLVISATAIYDYFRHTAAATTVQFCGSCLVEGSDFCVTWNKAVGRVFNVPYTTHTILLGQLLNTCHVSMQLVMRLCKFIYGMLVINNVIVRHMVRRAISSRCTVTSRQKYRNYS